SEEGTALAASIPGYRVAGKTGTVHKVTSRGYDKEIVRALFAGIVPARDPRLVMVTMIDEPRKGEHYGGKAAAPVFARTMPPVLRLLNIPPDDSLQAKPI
ncbi:MAG: penicillin-binding transpeptidase domain-containing protein, partial [Gammaproteobacteria bacterium]